MTTPPRMESTLAYPSYSRLACFQSCKEKYRRRYVDKDDKDPDSGSINLFAGKIFHQMLGDWFLTGDWEHVVESMEKSWPKVGEEEETFKSFDSHPFFSPGHVTAVLASVLDTGLYDDWKPVREVPINDSLVAWEKEPNADGRVETIEHGVQISISDIEPFKGLTVKMDLVLDQGDRFVVVDHKTSLGYLNTQTYIEAFMGYQLKSYGLAVETLTDTPVNTGYLHQIYLGKSANVSTSKAKKIDLYPVDWGKREKEDTKNWLRLVGKEMYDFHSGPIDRGSVTKRAGRHCSFCEFSSTCAKGRQGDEQPLQCCNQR